MPTGQRCATASNPPEQAAHAALRDQTLLESRHPIQDQTSLEKTGSLHLCAGRLASFQLLRIEEFMDVRASSRVAQASPTPDVARRSANAIDCARKPSWTDSHKIIMSSRHCPLFQRAASTRERDLGIFLTGLYLSTGALLVATAQALLSGRIRE